MKAFLALFFLVQTLKTVLAISVEPHKGENNRTWKGKGSWQRKLARWISVMRIRWLKLWQTETALKLSLPD